MSQAGPSSDGNGRAGVEPAGAPSAGKRSYLHCLRNLLPHRMTRVVTVAAGVPVVVGGCARSGTSLLLALLSAHPRLFAIPDETKLLCPGAFGGRPRFGNHNGPREMFLRLLQYDIPPECVRWCEKTPLNVLFFGTILRNFRERVRLIHIVRDGRDVVLSRLPTAPDRYKIDPDRWVRDVAAGLAFRGHPCVFTLRYEDLAADCEASMRRVCAFIGEDFVAEMVQPERAARVRTHRDGWVGQVRNVHDESIGKWRSPEHRGRVAEFLAYPRSRDLLLSLGYSV
jgi:hypothetical protein